ncbi:hypothetical protein [Cupriavidus basilensis]|nr:hypothetical protein [Cupriavidus basilensis]
MTAIAKVCAAIFGTSAVANGLACTPTTPASITVQIGAGEIYQAAPLEATACGTLPANTTYSILKQGIQLGTYTTGAFALPSTSGQSINYLIEAQYQDADISLDPTTGTAPVVLQFYNSANPTQPWAGPNNTGATSNTFRDGVVAYQVKAGVAAATGSQVTPTPDTGWVGLWVVTVPYGAASLTSANIAAYPGAPVLPGGVLQSAINGNLVYGGDNGSANVVQASFPLPSATLTDNQQFWVKIKAANTGATTFTPNPGVISPAPVVGAAHQALQGNELVANGRALFVWRADISSFVLLECTGGALQVAAAAQPQHAAQLGQIGHGQCRLSVVSGTSLKLAPYNGNNLVINGVPQQVSGAGVTIGNGGLAASTLYYVYAYMNAGAMALELSATGHTTGSTGIEQKTGDATRTLVGMIYTSAATPGQFSGALCHNFFNRRMLTGDNITNGSPVNFTNTSVAEVTAALRVSMLCWGDEGFSAACSGTASVATSGGVGSLGLVADGIQFGSYGNFGLAGSAIFAETFAVTGAKTLTEGLHIFQLWGAVTSGGSAALGASNGQVNMSVTTRG